MTLGKIENSTQIAAESQPDFDQMNKILKNKEQNIEKMKNIVIL
jgi:hypothetical protein